MAKRLLKRVDTKKLSARPPDPYGERFMKFMRDTTFELDNDGQKAAQLDFEKMKEELVAQIKKMLAEMIRDTFMKKGGGDKVSLGNFKGSVNDDEVLETEPASAVPAVAEAAPNLEQSSISLFSDNKNGYN